jgi:hypothetical protein
MGWLWCCSLLAGHLAVRAALAILRLPQQVRVLLGAGLGGRQGYSRGGVRSYRRRVQVTGVLQRRPSGAGGAAKPVNPPEQSQTRSGRCPSARPSWEP